VHQVEAACYLRCHSLRACRESLESHPDAVEVFHRKQAYRALIRVQALSQDGVLYQHSHLRTHPELLDAPEVHSVGLPKHEEFRHPHLRLLNLLHLAHPRPLHRGRWEKLAVHPLRYLLVCLVLCRAEPYQVARQDEPEQRFPHLLRLHPRLPQQWAWGAYPDEAHPLVGFPPESRVGVLWRAVHLTPQDHGFLLVDQV